MELLFELFLTISLSLIFTSLFIKLFAMTPIIADDKDNDHFFTEEKLQVDNFQWIPFKDEVIKLEEGQDQGKSRVEFYRVEGVEKEEVENSKNGDEIISLVEENDDDNEDDVSFDIGSKEKIQEDVKLFEIEIESVEEEEEDDECDHQGEIIKDDEMINDWEEVGIKDYEEILGNKVGLGK